MRVCFLFPCQCVPCLCLRVQPWCAFAGIPAHLRLPTRVLSTEELRGAIARATCYCCAPQEMASYPRLYAAGSVCTDFSQMGAQKKWMGQSALPFVSWAYETFHATPQFVLHECTPTFEVERRRRAMHNR
eukprot:849042-Alexandrium_andersonii.AAC.1